MIIICRLDQYIYVSMYVFILNVFCAFIFHAQMKAQGNAPVAVRWDRLLERHKCHTNCIQRVCDTLDKLGVNYSLIGRDEMHRGSLYDKDFVLTVGGDGTALNVASFLDGNVPIAGINSDPATVNKDYRSNRSDERKSKGALCAMTSLDVDEFLPKIVFGSFPPNSRTRIQCLVRNTYNEIRLPPALNDILIAHTSPAAVTRFRVSKYEGRVMPAFQEVHQEKV